MRLNKKTFEGDLRRLNMKAPFGTLILIASTKGLRAVLWEQDGDELTARRPEIQKCSPSDRLHRESLQAASEQLNSYFSGKTKKFSVPLDMIGTPFQISAWRALQKIPFGQTMSYGEQASVLGDRNKARAVGSANRTNPVSIIIPCHRVIGKSGALTGFAGGLKTKDFLLRLEQE